MAFDDGLAERVRDLLAEDDRIVERKMFGGLAFLLNGNMAVGVHEDDLIVRLPVDDTAAALARPGVRAFDLSGGRPMRGWVLVAPDATATERDLTAWVEIGCDYAETFPPK